MVRIRADEDDERWAEGFSPENDVFQRKDLADRLSNLYATLEQGSVGLLGGDWGIGKTTFVKMWSSMLKKRGISTVYVDAFAQDYISDPFEALCGTFVRAAQSSRKEQTPEFREFAERAAGVGKRLLPTIAKIGIKAATVGLVGSSEIEAVQTAIDTSTEAAADAVEERLKAVLEDHAQAEHSFAGLRQAISKLVVAIDRDRDGPSPRLIIIVDELDRCRPAFAVGLLEIIKHFFRADNVHFVIVTNRKSLTKSFAGVHNLGDEAEDYLSKFYDFTMHLTLPTGAYGRQYLRQYISAVFRDVLKEPHKTQFSYDLEDMCLSLSIANGLSLRQINAFVLIASLCVSSLADRQEVSAMLVSHLILMEVARPDLYTKAKTGTLGWSEMREIVPMGEDNEGYNGEHVYNVFGYFLAPTLGEVPEDYRNVGSGRLGISREGFIPYLANSVVDLFAQPSKG